MLWWVSRTGSYSSEILRKISSVGVTEEPSLIAEADIRRFARWIAAGEVAAPRSNTNATKSRSEFVSPDRKRPTPLMLAMSGLGLYGRVLSIRAVAERLAYVIGDSLDDFCLSYCLPRIGHQTVWLPVKWVSHLGSTEATLLRSCAMSALYARPYRAAQNPSLKVCSTSVQQETLDAVLGVLRARFSPGPNVEPIDVLSADALVALATGAPVPYCIDSPNQPEIHPFLGLESVGAIRSPRPTGFSKLSASTHRWVAELNIVGCAIPAVPHVAEHLVKLPQNGGTYTTRVSQHALAYTCPSGFVIGDDINANLQNPTIQIFDTFTAVSIIADANGYESQLSDKGIYQRDSLQKLGGSAEAARLFRDNASRAFLTKYLDHTDRPKGAYDEGCVLHGDKRAYLDLVAAKKTMGGNETAAIELLDKLVAAKVLYRGFALGCAVCKHAEWYSLSALADQFRCTRCGREQTIRHEHWKHPAAPQVFYKLDEIIYQFLKSDGDVVALGLDYMTRNSQLPFKYSPEIKFKNAGSQFSGEVDLCAVWDGELIIGEAKKQGELAPTLSEVQKIVKKYVHLANMLNARRVVFCTSSPEWKSSTIEAISTAFRGRNAAPRFLVAADLLGKPSS